jgi:hypothetical protein
MWIEIIKIMASSVITAIILGYIFNKRLEERKMLLKINEQLISSLISSLHVVINELKAIVEKAEDVKNEIETGQLHKETMDSFLALSDKYRTTFREHRIYLAPIVPYGISQPRPERKSEPINDLGLSALHRVIAHGRVIQELSGVSGVMEWERIKGQSRRKCLEAIGDLNAGYGMICYTANHIIDYLQKGKNPQSIRWEEVDQGLKALLK